MSEKKTINMGMVFDKFYCHKCGQQYMNNPITRTVRPGDPDYRKESRTVKGHLIGDVEVTEYNFKCPDCGNEIDYDSQCNLQQIQTLLGKNVLTDQEIAAHKPWVGTPKNKYDVLAKVLTFVGAAAVILAVVLLFVLSNS